jgi:hypothetical protein
MSIERIDRRHFLTLSLALLLAPRAALGAEPQPRRSTYAVDVGILYQVLTFHLEGTIEEAVDRAAGRYDVRVTGRGAGIANRIDSTGMLRDGRWAPVRSASWFQVHGRESRTQIAYDYERGTAEYHARGETFLLRRLRVVDDTLALPAGVQVDDAVTALLNYRDGRWTPQADGGLRTQVVRRRRTPGEGPDDVAREYRAELVPLDLKVVADPDSGRPTALFDLSRFSTWAREDRPARIVFADDRRPALITSSMILGTSITIRVG